MIFIFILFVVVSILLIWKGSDLLTDSLIPVANQLGTSYIAVTSLLASFMMSTPELFITIYSFILGHSSIGIGVVIGSVMMNIGFNLGLSAMITGLKIDKNLVIRDGIFLIVVAIIVTVMGSDLKYSRIDGIILLLMFIPYALNVWFFEKGREKDKREKKVKEIRQNLDLFGQFLPNLKLKPSLITFFIGFLFLFFGSYLFSFSLIEIARMVKVSELVIGFVFGAIGTSIPNIAAAVNATIKGYRDAALTETFGSNIFTLLVTLGIFIILNPIQIAAKIFYFDMIWMIVFHILLLAFIFKGYKYKEASITRVEGIILLTFYVLIVLINVLFF